MSSEDQLGIQIETLKANIFKTQLDIQNQIVQNYIETKKVQYVLYKLMNPDAIVPPSFSELDIYFKQITNTLINPNLQQTIESNVISQINNLFYSN
mgnify:CR=1 FL=1